MRSPLRFALILFTLTLLFAGGAFAAPPITWDPGTLEVEIGSGLAEPVQVTFHSSKSLDDLTAEVVPELAPFLSVSNPVIATVEEGSDHTLELSLYLPPETPEGVYDGVLRLRQGRRSIARPLPILLTVDYGDNIVAPGTRVLSRDAAARVVEVSTDGRMLTFEGVDQELQEIAYGDVVILPTADLLPAGFLGRVVSTEQEGDRLTVVTEPAALTDAVLSAEIEADFDLAPHSIVAGREASAQTLAQKGLFEPIEVPFEVVLFDADNNPTTTTDQVRATGGITLTPDMNLTLDIDDGEVQEFSVAAVASAVTELAVEAEFAVAVDKEVDLARYRFRPVVFWVGWVPVYLQPVLAFSVDVSAEAQASFEAGARAEAAVELAIVYDGADWSTVEDSSLELSAIGPTLEASAALEGRAGPELTVLLYGVVGPELQLSGFARLDAVLDRCPYWWELNAGVGLDAGVNMGPFSDLVTGPSYPGLISFEKLLAHAPECTDDDDGGDGGGDDDGGTLQERIFVASNRLGDQDIWSMAPDGSDLRLIVQKPGAQSQPAVSPDGTKLAYVDGPTRRWVVLDLTTGDEIVLDGTRATGNYEWSADGTAIIGSWSSCSNDIRRYPLTGGQSVLLNEPSRDTLWAVDWNTGRFFYTNDPCWSPSMRIKSYDPSSGSKTVLQGNDGRSESQGNVSLDGEWLVYDKADYSYYGPSRIHVISTSGGPETRISSRTGAHDRFPHFSPDASEVTFTREIDGTRGIWAVDRDGANERPLLVDEFNNLTPDWAMAVMTSGATPGGSYVLSRLQDGTGAIGVDDDLDVYLNGVEIFHDPDSLSGSVGPITFTGRRGDELRLVVTNNYVTGSCSLSDVFLSTPGGNSTLVASRSELDPACPIGTVLDRTIVLTE